MPSQQGAVMVGQLVALGLFERAEDQTFVPTKELRGVEIERAYDCFARELRDYSEYQLAAPSFSTRERMGAGRHPQHGREGQSPWSAPAPATYRTKRAMTSEGARQKLAEVLAYSEPRPDAKQRGSGWTTFYLSRSMRSLDSARPDARVATLPPARRDRHSPHIAKKTSK